MVDKYTADGIRRKRPEPDEVYARQARAERQARLRIPLRERLKKEDDYLYEGDAAITKADVRGNELDSSREKNASIHDKKSKAYEARRERVLERWADKVERKEAIERGKSVIEARKGRKLLRNALLEGEGLDEMDALLGKAPDRVCGAVIQRDERIARQARQQPSLPLSQLAEEGIEAVLPPKYRAMVVQGRNTGTKKEK